MWRSYVVIVWYSLSSITTGLTVYSKYVYINTYCIGSNYGSGIYFFPAIFHPGHWTKQAIISRRFMCRSLSVMPAMNLMADDVTQSTIFCVVKFVIVLPTLQGHKTGPWVCMRPAIIQSNTVTILVTCVCIGVIILCLYTITMITFL